MVLVKATKDSEAGMLPSTELLTKMGKFNEELAKAGVLLAGEGLKPSSQGKRITFTAEKPTVIKPPMTMFATGVSGIAVGRSTSANISPTMAATRMIAIKSRVSRSQKGLVCGPFMRRLLWIIEFYCVSKLRRAGCCRQCDLKPRTITSGVRRGVR